MGLNHCQGQGRRTLSNPAYPESKLPNACAGQGYCSTALASNPGDPGNGLVSDHTCHVLNQCKSQGGCGLYGTSDEQNAPGANDCRSLGSCATPINAERFSTDGDNRGKSVWVRARQKFASDVWPSLRAKNAKLPETPPQVPGATDNANLFAYGPTIEWIEASGNGMTACGASGMSGAGSCA
ncbi:MAG: hypothetical protein IH605_06515 [Burkholderiales bacterium]|nr:hypothetical protein [Burkholderiales bacterium]